MNIPNHIFEGLDNFFWLKMLKFVDADPDPGSGNLLTLDPGSGINIPNPQHCLCTEKRGLESSLWIQELWRLLDEQNGEQLGQMRQVS